MLSSTFWHVLAESISLVALGQTVAFCEAKKLRLKANLLREKELLPKVNLLLAKALLQKAALLDWSVPGLKLPDICLASEEKPRRKLTKETCPDRGSNPGLLHDRRASYHLSHSGGPHHTTPYPHPKSPQPTKHQHQDTTSSSS